MPKTAKAAPDKAKGKQDSADNAPQADSKKQVQSVEFLEAAETEGGGSTGNLDILLDVNVPVTVNVGRTEIPIRRLLQLGPGSILQLDKPIGAPADLYLRDAKFASADVVVVDGKFAVRIKQIIGNNVASGEPEP
jgi:flagellar motor switch protein FliN/FliY